MSVQFTSGAFWDSGLQLCLVPAGVVARLLVDPQGDKFSLSTLSLMFSLFFDLWIAANNSSFDMVLFVGDKIRLVGVFLPEEVWTGVLLPEELSAGDEQLLSVFSARRSATVDADRAVGVDDLKPLPYPWPIGEIGLFLRMSAVGDFVRGSLAAGEDAKNRYPSAARFRGVANLFKHNETLDARSIAITLILLASVTAMDLAINDL